MKKWLSAMLAICLLMVGMTCAAGEGIYNNGEAPELISVTNTQGEVSAAVIRDAQGSVIATIPDDGSLKIVYVGDRYEEHPEIEQLLYHSLDTLIWDEHIAAPELYLETDVFYAEIPEEYEGYLTDGALVEMVFKPLIMQKVSEVIVLTSVDGETWNEAPSAIMNGDGTVTVGIEQNCVVAFLIVSGEHEELFGTLTDEVVTQTTETIVVETNPNFTPSVSGKPDPQITVIEVEGEPCIALITAETGEILEKVTDRDTIIVTPLSEREINPDVITYDHLQWAYDTICAAPDMGGLPNEGAEGTLGDEIDRRLEGTGLDRFDLTVSDLFEVTAYGEPLRVLLDNPGARLELTVERNFRNDEILMVLCASDVDHWHVMDEQYVTINEDGSVSLSLEHHGVLVFLVERMDADFNAAGESVVTAP